MDRLTLLEGVLIAREVEKIVGESVQAVAERAPRVFTLRQEHDDPVDPF